MKKLFAEEQSFLELPATIELFVVLGFLWVIGFLSAIEKPMLCLHQLLTCFVFRDALGVGLIFGMCNPM